LVYFVTYPVLLTPKGAYFERLGKVCDEQKGRGFILVRGLFDRDEGDEEEDEKDSAEATPSIINDSRVRCLKMAAKFTTCGQHENDCADFDTETGNEVIYGMPAEIDKTMKKKNMTDRFDNLFALTYRLGLGLGLG
jgi:hypothetical protein